jgi:hypothetical protein
VDGEYRIRGTKEMFNAYALKSGIIKYGSEQQFMSYVFCCILGQHMNNIVEKSIVTPV